MIHDMLDGRNLKKICIVMQSQTVHLRSRFKIFEAAKVQKAHRERVEGVANSGGRMDSRRFCFLRRLDMVNFFGATITCFILISFGCSHFQFFSSSSSQEPSVTTAFSGSGASAQGLTFVAHRGTGPLARRMA